MTYPHTTFKISPRYDQLQGNFPICFSPYPPPPVPCFLWVFKVPQGLLTTVICCYLSVTHLLHWVLWCKHPLGLYSSHPRAWHRAGLALTTYLLFTAAQWSPVWMLTQHKILGSVLFHTSNLADLYTSSLLSLFTDQSAFSLYFMCTHITLYNTKWGIPKFQQIGVKKKIKKIKIKNTFS